MAHTAYGNLTGQAAVTDRQDFREYLFAEQRKYAAEVRRLKDLKEHLAGQLVEVEGANVFYAWWESSEVPDGDPTRTDIHRTHIHLLEERLRYAAWKLLNQTH